MSDGDAIRKLYSAKVMELANDIPLQIRLDAPDATVERRSPLCGSRITVDLKLDGDIVAEYGHVVRACTLGQTAASVMARHVVGSDVETLRQVTNAMRALLKEGKDLPYKSRHGSILLAFEAVEEALEEITSKMESTVG
ncbi:MAG: iron-sulfur cluster assembly scaffold protein [Alphaproteobacteria bacterium]